MKTATVDVAASGHIVSSSRGFYTGPHTFTLRYDSSDPHAVTLDCGDRVEWLFARTLLAEGLRGPAGIGDVRVWACQDIGTVRFAVTSPEGWALLELPQGRVHYFLRRTYALFGRAAELEPAIVDGWIGRILAGAS